MRRAFADGDWLPEEETYLDWHAPRLAFTVELIRTYIDTFAVRTILDVGQHFLTLLLKQQFEPEITVSTLGWANPRFLRPGVANTHYEFDLTNCTHITEPPTANRYGLILLAETLEHLYVSPGYVLPFLAKLLQPGGVLIIQTPNAVALTKRLTMLRGRNPYELIREDLENPGHFREYTMSELVAYGREARLRPYQQLYCDYWRPRRWPLRAAQRLYPPFREGLTIAFTLR